MGASESKIAVASSESKVDAVSTPKSALKQRPQNDRLCRLIDPRSPSTEIDRTPIQVGAPSRPVEVGSECPASVPAFDPRSPTVGITRTPMKVTVRSFARRLGMLFLSDTVDGVTESSALPNLKVEEVREDGEQASSSEPLLNSPSDNGVFPHSPFVLLTEGDAQMEVEVETEAEADLSLGEAEEAKESPLHKRLSMSLITCHEGVVPVQIFAEIHQDCPQSPLIQGMSEEQQPTQGPEHSYAISSISSDPVCPEIVTPSETPVVSAVAEVAESPELPEENIEKVPEEVEEAAPVVATPEVLETAPQEEVTPVPVEATPEVLETAPQEEATPVPSPAAPSPAAPSPAGQSPNPTQPALTGIRCPTMDTKSPSQLVFKPQWLGKGFGATGNRARVQGRGGKGGSSSSPLALRVGAKNTTDENKGQQATKQKQRGMSLAEGRSPLQILKETNSPRDKPTQMKLKVSTPDRQRLGQMDRRVLTVSLNKENR